MTKDKYIITDIFSYLPAKSVSLEQIESAFRRFMGDGSAAEDDTSVINITLAEQLLTDDQRQAVSELQDLDRKIAYALHDASVFAIIGYKDKE